MKPLSPHQRQQGVALPIMLIMMLIMLITGVYLLRSSNSATLIASNLAYDATLSRAVDLGLHRGFQWLSTTSNDNKAALDGDIADDGYRASLDPSVSTRDAAYWQGSVEFEDAEGNQIRYVIHRMCLLAERWDEEDNQCVQTASNSARLGNTAAIGDSLAADAPAMASSPQLHYVITARLDGVRGGNVINQMVVLVGA